MSSSVSRSRSSKATSRNSSSASLSPQSMSRSRICQHGCGNQISFCRCVADVVYEHIADVAIDGARVEGDNDTCRVGAP